MSKGKQEIPKKTKNRSIAHLSSDFFCFCFCLFKQSTFPNMHSMRRVEAKKDSWTKALASLPYCRPGKCPPTKKTRAFSFKRRTASVRESVRMGLSSHAFDVRAINLVREEDDENENLDSARRNESSASSLEAKKRKKTFSRIRQASNDVVRQKSFTRFFFCCCFLSFLGFFFGLLFCSFFFFLCAHSRFFLCFIFADFLLFFFFFAFFL